MVMEVTIGCIALIMLTFTIGVICLTVRDKNEQR